MPTHPRPDSPKTRQDGGVLLVMIVILVVGVTAALISSLSTTAIANKRNTTSAEALAKARDALVGYAVTYGDTHASDTHGYLPCPDPDGNAGANQEGSSETCGTAGANALGRLPWRTLQLPALYDGAQECLWYAVSGSYKNNPKAGLTMNWDTPAQLHVYGSDGNEIAPGEIVAIVIAPGGVLPGNAARSGTAAPTCGGNYTAAAYLDHDTIHNINNADAATAKFILPHQHSDAAGNVTLSINDQFIYITRQDIWSAVQKRIGREAQQCLDDYAASSSGKYPWTTPVASPEAIASLLSVNSLFGRFHSASPSRQAPSISRVKIMQTKFLELWTALEAFASNKTWANLFVMKNKADAAKDAASDVEDYYDGSPENNPALMNAADDLKDAADAARDTLTTSSSDAYISSIQQDMISAADDFAANLPVDSSMASTWPSSCNTLFSSPHWSHWKDMVFCQISSGFRPSSSPSCGTPNTCLSITGSAHAAAGSGTYRASVIVAGKLLTASRTSTDTASYLEADNLLPQNDVAYPYKTYRMTDAEYQTVNDLVLCLDGEVNCR